MFKSLDKFVHLSEGCTGSWKGDTHHRPAPSCSVRSLYRGQPTIYMLLGTWHQTGQVSSASKVHFPPPQVQSCQCDSNSQLRLLPHQGLCVLPWWLSDPLSRTLSHQLY